MREHNTHATNQSNIHCLEVLISKNHLTNNSGLLWTLSVYSLENQPVNKNRAIHNSDIFHFMVYDWKRTIKQLLEQHQVPYSVIQLFSIESIYSDVLLQENVSPDKELDFLKAIEKLPLDVRSSGTPALRSLDEIPAEEQVDIWRS